MKVKILFAIIGALFLSNSFLLFYVIKYRKSIIIRNKSFEGIPLPAKYKNANYLLKLFKQNKFLYQKQTVFIGSSIIERWDFEKFFNGLSFVNRGIGNETSSDLLKRYNEDVIQLEPINVVIYISSNDIKFKIPIEQTVQNLKQMLEISLANEIKPLVLILSPINFKKKILGNIIFVREMKLLRNELIELCGTLNVDYVDLLELIGKRQDFEEFQMKDGIHLNNRGYSVLQKAIFEKLTIK